MSCCCRLQFTIPYLYYKNFYSIRLNLHSQRAPLLAGSLWSLTARLALSQ
uniref:Uncharacterized protein n=1 Tax=Anguilla anguilla TaxID=7936 RepID=A0A0E9PTJ5_ANGAN